MQVNTKSQSKTGSERNFLKAFIATAFCFIIIYLGGFLLGPILHLVEKFNPLSKWEDTELSDLYFSYFSNVQQEDSNIVLVDCSDLNRKGIGDVIEAIAIKQPSVIGVDIQFDSDVDTNGTVFLQQKLIKYSSKVVLGIDEDTCSDLNTICDKSNLPFYKQIKAPLIHFGYLQFDDSCKVIREFKPVFKNNKLDDIVDTSFAVKVIRLADTSNDLKQLFTRGKNKEIIHYRNIKIVENDMSRYVSRFLTIKPIDINSYNFSNKIVLLGDGDKTKTDDLHFSPLNGRLQRTFPDIKGVEIHANAISTILSHDYINPLPFKYVWIFLFCLLSIYLFMKNHLIHKGLFHIYLDGLVLILSPVFMCLSIGLMLLFKLKLEPGDFIIPFFLSGLFVHLYEVVKDKYFTILKRKKQTK